jgi:hypothetical protein
MADEADGMSREELEAGPPLRIARAVLLGTLIAGALAAGAGYIALTSPWGGDRVRRSMVGYLSDKFDAEVAIAEMSISVVPRLSIQGRGLTLTKREDVASGPFVTLERFEVKGTALALLRRHLDAVSVDGFEFRVRKSAVRGNKARRLPRHDVSIDRIDVSNGTLLILPNNPEKLPLQFDLAQVTLEDFGFDRSSSYRARLTNPKPRGYIDSTGLVGPWNVEELRLTPLSGGYTFEDADMATINGIGGRLNSTGKFEGHLERIRVTGVASVPDFNLEMTRQPVKLDTRFRATVDGTSGDTYLDEVLATLGQSKIRATGSVAGAPKAKGRSVLLDVQIEDGRLEDVLRLSVKGARPPLRGALTMRTAFDLPPGEKSVPERLILKGSFTIRGGQFTSDTVQEKVDSLSRRGRGEPTNENVQNVLSAFGGAFSLGNGLLQLPRFQFRVRGSTVDLSGNYGLRSEAMNFAGTLSLDAPLSKTTTGVKSFLLKAVDPLFRRRGAGTVVPIKIAGTVEKPEFGVDVGRVIRRK